MGPTAEVSRFVAEVDGRKIPDEALRLARTAFVDVAATTLAGAAQPAGRIMTVYVRESGGSPEASVVAAGFKTAAARAALANGAMAHALLYDHTTTVTAAHHSVALAPARLALPERTGATGRAVLEAYVFGFETLDRGHVAINLNAY